MRSKQIPFTAAAKKCLWLGLAFLWLSSASRLEASTRAIVRVSGGLTTLKSICALLGCTVQYGLGDPLGQVFLVSSSGTLSIQLILGVPGILDVELDTLGKTSDATVGPVPAALYDSAPINYYGASVRDGYVNQPATELIGLAKTQNSFGVAGGGVVAVIDTGVDPSHPVLNGVLVSGYDFTRNQAGIPDEKGDVTQSTTAVVDQSTTAVVDQSTTAVIDQTTAATLNQSQYAGFGHGTMVAGVIHLVAPRAQIMPLKAFSVNGSGWTSDVIRAIYFAQRNGAKILNMSFSFSSPSAELKSALEYVNGAGVIGVAAAGNNGQQILVYPAAYTSDVMGVASTSESDTQSSFTNYGNSLVWLTAPGEGVVTLYPYNTYAATWGTSFSAPFVSGAAALLLNVHSCNESQAARALANAKYISNVLGNGRLQLYEAVQAWRAALGLD